MPRVEALKQSDGSTLYFFVCPGCGEGHGFTVGPGGGPRWSFDGDLERPTFSPSLHVTVRGRYRRTCHSFVIDGQIRFLNDCTHELAGKTVDLPELDEA